MNKEQEALDILQEECAEIIQIISKCRRFGLDEVHIKSGSINRQLLNEEVGDMLALVDVLIDRGILSMGKLEVAKAAKIQKLKAWSTIFKQGNTNEDFKN